ncbi:TGF-beta family protein [Endozoicomonas euniceicola]|uniref:TGF-beta family protein n=1 Tax=Endozoicomonas euniceicola TaxID=1234143 RepID=A0ABY6GYM4_9GAMM|nr:TGF-beta family protein [Endozoicomonas euniceicola]UYM17775.1 TGF-beta family protein [Endozoicomonas euniceicola]
MFTHFQKQFFLLKGTINKQFSKESESKTLSSCFHTVVTCFFLMSGSLNAQPVAGQEELPTIRESCKEILESAECDLLDPLFDEDGLTEDSIAKAAENLKTTTGKELVVDDKLDISELLKEGPERRKRSLGAPVIKSVAGINKHNLVRTNSGTSDVCRVAEKIIDMSGMLGAHVVAPLKFNIGEAKGSCSYDITKKHFNSYATIKNFNSMYTGDSLQCVPVRFKPLMVLTSHLTEVRLTTFENAVLSEADCL